MIVDSHQHFWAAGGHHTRWVTTPETRDLAGRDFTPEDLRPELDAAGVQATVLVQSIDAIDDTLTLLQIAADCDFVAGVVGWVPLECAEHTAEALERFADNPHLRGVRHTFSMERDPRWLARRQVHESLAAVAERGYVFDAMPATTAQQIQVLDLAREMPELRVVLDHLARPPLLDPVGSQASAWHAFIEDAATLKNVFVKASLPLHVLISLARLSAEQLRPYVEVVLEHFGSDRVMFASNWPISLLTASYAMVFHETARALDSLSPVAEAAVFGGTAMKCYDLVLDPCTSAKAGGSRER